MNVALYTIQYNSVFKIHDFLLWNIKDYSLKNVVNQTTMETIDFYCTKKKKKRHFSKYLLLVPQKKKINEQIITNFIFWWSIPLKNVIGEGFTLQTIAKKKLIK